MARHCLAAAVVAGAAALLGPAAAACADAACRRAAAAGGDDATGLLQARGAMRPEVVEVALVGEGAAHHPAAEDEEEKRDSKKHDDDDDDEDESGEDGEEDEDESSEEDEDESSEADREEGRKADRDEDRNEEDHNQDRDEEDRDEDHDEDRDHDEEDTDKEDRHEKEHEEEEHDEEDRDENRDADDADDADDDGENGKDHDDEEPAEDRQADDDAPPEEKKVTIPSPEHCESGVLLKVHESTAMEGMKMKWAVKHSEGGGSCSDETEHGPGACCTAWGSNLTTKFLFDFKEDVTPEWRIAMSMKLQVKGAFRRFINLGAYQFECPACGAECALPDLEVAGKKVMKDKKMKMPDCDKTKSAHFDFGGTMPLPKKSPVPMQIRTTGTMTAKYPDGTVASEISLSTRFMP